MSEIYLLGSDEYKDSIDLSFYADDEESLIELLRVDILELGNILIKDSVKIHFLSRSISFKCYSEWLGETEADAWDDTYYITVVERY